MIRELAGIAAVAAALTACAGSPMRAVTPASRAASADCASYRRIAAEVRHGIPAGASPRQVTAAITAGGRSVLDDWVRPLNIDANLSEARFRVPQGTNAARVMAARMARVAVAAGYLQVSADLRRYQRISGGRASLDAAMSAMDRACRDY